IEWARLAPILRGELAAGEGGARMLLHRRTSDAIDAYLGREDLAEVSQRGTPTPDHVIRTKRVPLLLAPTPEMDDAALRAHVRERLAAFRAEYDAYVAREAAAKGREVTKLDPNPRVVLVPGVGLVSAGKTEKAARVAADLHEHCVEVVEAAEAVGTYEVLPLGDVFDMEYWGLEQAKLGKKAPKPMAAQVVYVSGAASGIGAATARRFGAAGASLYLTDRDGEALAALAGELGAAHEVVDVSEHEAVRASVRRCVETFGGVDVVVSNAGVAPQGALHEVDDAVLRQSFEVNFFAHQTLAAAATRVMRAQGLGGALLFNASKAAFNPGKNFGPYALPKAAVIALMKQYAVENGEAGIRANAVNADRIRTGLLPPGFVKERAAARGLEPDQYFRSNLLGREVTAGDVADAFYALAEAPSTTGCVITVDGGNIAASPR
ncbi:MAG TPA: SDR family oxidoreductase, partial [Polyangiaceae bacterium LLY-WYZ-15_(1-7)]|nr:SDR family oxidoreductase [Polyangiaceae bacterium LLY-WYZ-15_(1-7)]